MVVRDVPATDREQFEWALQYAFSPSRGPGSTESSGDWPPALYTPRAVYDAGRLCATSKLYTLPGRVRGTETTVGGVGGVATLPEHRESGHVRRLCRDALGWYADRDVPLAALWPFSTPFYERLGWGTAYGYSRLTTPPEQLPSHDPRGSVVRLDATDWERLSAASDRADRDATFRLARTEQWWHEQRFSDDGWGSVPYCYGYERDGRLAGYLSYQVADDDQTLTVENFVTVDEEARRALLDFLGCHGAQIESVVVHDEPDTELLARLDDPGPATCELHRGPMVRLTTVDALAEFGWPTPTDGDPSAEVDCRLTVTDPLSVVDGVYRLQVANGTATVDPVDDTPPSEGSEAVDTDVTVGVGTLSRLAVGACDVATATRLGDLSVGDDRVRASLANVFRPGTVRLRQFF
ncbi:MAG: putative acetyltransferase involved in intracellular survival related acetyltransferase [halophilic archaeon J07HB67]|nr:MAG: putative acetyltransferase involved in intracellular survival related acetyltransferase [halophilic archaeon J07HB67]